MGFLDLNGLSHYNTKITSYITTKLDAIKALIPTKVSQLTNDSGFTKTTVAASTTNGNILVNATETKVYALPTSSDTVLGGVKIGTNITNTSGVISVANGTTSAKGVVQLTDGTSSTSTTTAATAKSAPPVRVPKRVNPKNSILFLQIIKKSKRGLTTLGVEAKQDSMYGYLHT